MAAGGGFALMAAAPVGRVCCCGCGRSIDDRPSVSTRTRECQRQHEIERWRARNSLVQESARKSMSERRSSVNPRQNCVKNAFWGDTPNRRQKPCQLCCGLPWARTPERYGEDGRSIVDDMGRCRGCGDAYAPEPPPTRESTIGSSAGVATRHGDLYGVSIDSPRKGESRVKKR